jgi:hypothetical protein
MDKQTFLATLRRDRGQWDALLAQIARERMTAPGVVGAWSIKDIIAHVTWHEREMVGLATAHALVGSELWNLPQDQRNAAIYEQNRQRDLDDVLREAQQVFQELVAALAPLSNEDLNDPARFPGMPPDWVPWQIIAGNTYEHYQHHTPSIRAWLGRLTEHS